MEILDSKVNADGNFELLIQYPRTVMMRETAEIKSREFAAKNGMPDAAEMTDEEYLESALQGLREMSENPEPIPAEKLSAAESMKGRVITAKADVEK